MTADTATAITAPQTIIIRDPDHGLPWGVYDVRWYRRGKEVAWDTDVSSGYVGRAARNLGRGESIIAVCRSQPGGLVAYGSAAEMRRHPIA